MLKKNLIANFAGSGWSALMGLAFIPFYIHLLGAEAYGIVGVFSLLQATFAVLDLGLSQTLSREMARLSAERGNADLMADTARTLEIIYWGIALGVAAVIILLSDFMAYRWLNPELLSRESLVQALWLMGVVVGLRWPVALYMGGLNGLQRQVAVNVLLIVFTTLQGGGSLALLWFLEPTLKVFFLWQAFVALVQAVVLRGVLWRSLASDRAGEFRRDVLKSIWRFAMGVSGISFLAIILMQADKLLLSKLLTLSEFGYYTFAASAAGILQRVFAPVFTVYYPRLTELVSKNDQSKLATIYHQGCQLMAAVVFPLALCMTMFSTEILELWTRNPQLVSQASVVMAFLVVGNMLGGLMNMPYALQLSCGWTRLTFYANLVAVVILVPAIYYATQRWGKVGAASVWIVLNAGYLLFYIPFMHRHLLVGEKWRWYVDDVGKPLLAALTVVGLGRLLTLGLGQNYEIVIWLIVIFCSATMAAVGASNYLRPLIFSPLSKNLKRI